MAENATDGRHERRNRGRQQALETAAQIFSEGGLVQTMAFLAERTGISERTLFRYFTSQDQLIEAVTDYLIPHIAPYFSTEAVDGNLEHRLRALVNLRLEYVRKYSSMIRTLETHSARFNQASEIRRARDILLDNQYQAWLGEDRQKMSNEIYAVTKSLIELRSLDAMNEELGQKTAQAVGDAILHLINKG